MGGGITIEGIMDKQTIINELQVKIDQLEAQKTGLENFQVARISQLDSQKAGLIASHNAQLANITARQDAIQTQINELNGE